MTQSAAQDFEKYQVQGDYHWSTLKPSWKTTFNLYLHARYSSALSALPGLGHGLKAADLGCGDGYMALQMAKRGFEAQGIEGMEAAVKIARGKAQGRSDVRFEVGNVCATGLPSASFDLVYSLDVIEHLPDAKAFLTEMKRIAKPGATVVIGTPIRFTEKPIDEYHVHEFFPDEFRSLLGEYFEVISHRKSHPVEYVVWMRKKYNLFGKKKNLGWNWMNLYFLLTGKNLLAQEDSEFPTYQLAICRVGSK